MSANDPNERDADGIETIADGRKSPVKTDDFAQFPNYLPAGAKGATRASDQRTMIADEEYVEASPDEDSASLVMVKKDYLDDQKTVLRDAPPAAPAETYDPNATVLSNRPPPTATEIGSPVPVPASLPKASVRRPYPSGKHPAPRHPDPDPGAAPLPGAASAPVSSTPPASAAPAPGGLAARPSPSLPRPQGAPIPVAGLPAPPTEEVIRSPATASQSLPVRTWLLLLVTAAAAFVMFFGESFGLDLFGNAKRSATSEQRSVKSKPQAKQEGSGDGSKAQEATPPKVDEVLAGLTLPSETSELMAAEALLGGKKREALGHYVLLSRQQPDNQAFAAMVTILAREERSK